MAVIDRRSLLLDILPGAVAAAGVASAGVILLPKVAQALPATLGSAHAVKAVDLIEHAQVVAVNRRRRRRWVCWWHGRRRVCGWRYR